MEFLAEYQKVPDQDLVADRLLDRSLFVRLEHNKRVMCVAHKFQFLEQTKIDKIKKLGGAYAQQEQASVRYPLLNSSLESLTAILNDENLASFEIMSRAQEILRWTHPFITDPLLKGDGEVDLELPVFLYSRVLSLPSKETLDSLAGADLPLYEQSLKAVFLSVHLAFCLGYYRVEFLNAWAEAVFCHDLGYVVDADVTHSEIENYRDLHNPLSEKGWSRLKDLVQRQCIPGLKGNMEVSLSWLSEQRTLNPRLDELVDLVRWVRNRVGQAPQGIPADLRLKLNGFFSAVTSDREVAA